MGVVTFQRSHCCSTGEAGCRSKPCSSTSPVRPIPGPKATPRTENPWTWPQAPFPTPRMPHGHHTRSRATGEASRLRASRARPQAFPGKPLSSLSPGLTWRNGFVLRRFNADFALRAPLPTSLPQTTLHSFRGPVGASVAPVCPLQPQCLRNGAGSPPGLGHGAGIAAQRVLIVLLAEGPASRF